MPEPILVGVLILLALAAGGALIMWRLWVSVKRQYAEFGDEVPVNIKWLTGGLTFTVVGPPLILVFSLIYLT